MRMVDVYIMGKRYEVPPNLTIIKAMEYAGYRLVRGVGCRAGFCGACATVYRTKDDYRLKIGLACQTVIEPEMYIAQIPFFPVKRADYRLDELEATFETLVKLYPELLRCLSCGVCTKSCPQDLDVKDYMADAMKGDIAAVAQKSFDCIMCGLCAARCPAEEPQYRIALLCQRLYGKHLAPKSKHLEEKVRDIEEGRFAEEMERMKGMSKEELRRMYAEREIEK